MDIALHTAAIEAGTFGTSGSQFLRENSGLKRRVLALLPEAQRDPAEVTDVIKGLRDCQAIHRAYLALPPSTTTGSHEWHHAWMSAYEEWISALTRPALRPDDQPSPG